jgi:hypothetical protein
MADWFTERLQPSAGVTALERQDTPRDRNRDSRRRPPQKPAPPKPDEPSDESEPPHQLDHMA